MGPSMLGFIICISLLLSTRNFSVLAQLVSTTLYSTHPQVTYAPESCCARNIFGRCAKRYDPFEMSTYFGPDGKRRTFFQTGSSGNEPRSWNMKRRVEVKFYGGAVKVYGPPQAQLYHRLGHIQVSLDGLVMATIDLENKYREANDEPWNPQLMYHWDGGGGDAAHVLVISLLDSATGFWKWHPIRGFGFDSVVYTSFEPWRPPKYELSASERLENVKVHDTNFVMSFKPSSAWEKRISDISSSEGIQTFHGTSNELAHSSGVTPVAKFTTRCAALAIYGASPAQLQATFADGFRHGHIQICQWRHCKYVDVHQTYLNVPQHLWTEPVLLYATDRMSPRVSETVTMSLLDPSSPVGHIWAMTFSHAVCSQVVHKWPWTHPIPDGNYSSSLVQHHELDYGPSFLSSLFPTWSRTDLYNFADAEPRFLGLFGSMPSWSTTVQGHDIQIFVPSPAQFPAFQYANIRCCIDGRCHYPDIEQWFLKARNAPSDIPLVHYQDLNPFRDHHISMTAVRKSDEVGEKVTAVSRVVSQRVAVACPPPSIPPTPSETPDCLSWPDLKEPIEDDDDDLGAFASTAVVFVAVMFLVWCIASGAMDAQRQQPEKEYLLPPPGSCKQPPQGYQFGTRRSYSSCETDYRLIMKAELAVNQSTGSLGFGSGLIPAPGDHLQQLLSFYPETSGRTGSSLTIARPLDSPSQPIISQACAPGPSNARHSSNPGPPLPSWNWADNGSPVFITDWNTSTHHDLHPFSDDGTDGGPGTFSPTDSLSTAVWSSSGIVQDTYWAAPPLGFNIDQSSYLYSGQSTNTALGPAIRGAQLLSSPYTALETLTPYSHRGAPPSYPRS
ncbi:hypothetical protein M407DRAFT_20819 [Tulasnella calospora MUT 4182]|uniref:Glycoside hydrolase family 16 protein n=1 Tax=Tulasnella calospora MUT 4182 TaxID=1051891 RepID=A0A0C3QPF2_9AGAM|nr:hypothetical protein M407DRAFT_20819 [Tulasnella calospora MUT 4182]